MRDHINYLKKNNVQKSIGEGKHRLLPYEVEEYLVQGIILAGELGWPFRRQQIREVVGIYCQKMKIPNRFEPDGLPGKDWMDGFIRRNCDKIAPRVAEVLTKARASGLTREILNAFYDKFEKKLDEYIV